MPAIRRLFLDHPASVNESYWQHMGQAGSFGWAMLRASGACFVHALVPALCVRTGSGIIRDLHQRMVTQRTLHPAASYPAGSRPAALPPAGLHPAGLPPAGADGADEALLWIAANI